MGQVVALISCVAAVSRLNQSWAFRRAATEVVSWQIVSSGFDSRSLLAARERRRLYQHVLFHRCAARALLRSPLCVLRFFVMRMVLMDVWGRLDARKAGP